MKTGILTGMMLMLAGSVAVAQDLEVDDMYFKAKDRVALNSKREPKFKSELKIEESEPLNPTDSYSARNVNPEYISRSKMDPNSQVASDPYFIPNYQPVNVNRNLSNTNAWNDWNNWNSPWNRFGYNSFGMSPFNSWGFNSFYPSSSWLTMSMGWGYGGWNSWNSPSWSFWDSYYGWNSWNSLSWNNPWGWNSWNSWNSWNNPWAYNYYRPTIIVVGNGNEARQRVVYGKRSARSSDIDNNYVSSGRNAYVDSNGRTRGSNAGGRMTDDSNNYYRRGWRTNPAGNESNMPNTTSGRSSSGRFNSWGFDNNQNSNNSWFDNGGSRGRSSSFGSGSNFSTGGGGRSFSGGTTGGGTSSGSRTRGRD